MRSESLPRRLWAAIARTTPGIDADTPVSPGTSGQVRSALARTPESTGMVKARNLLAEDRADYERSVDMALAEPELQQLLAIQRAPLTVEQLRVMALNATALITPAAAMEYRSYTALRERHRLSQGRTGRTEEAGVGALAVVTVLVPVLGGVMALLLLAAGYLLRLAGWPGAGPLVTGGWIAAAVTAIGILAGAAGLLAVALRVRDTAVEPEPSEEVTRARSAWQAALLDRGIRRFLREAIGPPGTPVPSKPGTPPGPSTGTPG
ncbi:hypothetical protein [Streptomyces adustus]|uniref:hypothetical protein n=1 Tax=Streptomyces adustus TaxID=1609272 RepID=UPI00371D3346